MGSESERSEKAESDSEDDICSSDGGKQHQEQKRITEYEEQRLSRIAENKARMEALGLRTMASSLMAESSRGRGRGKGKGKSKVDNDADYIPTDEDNDDDYEAFESSKVKNKAAKSKKKLPVKTVVSAADYVDEDEQLMQAIALSLLDSAKDSSVKEEKGNAQVPEQGGRKNRKRSFNSRVKMTEDELVLHFFQFDEYGRGSIGVRDLQSLAVTHDFTWTDKELADMIHCFDTNGDGRLTLEDFRKIVERCNMIQGLEI